ncbi:hypothetical protein BH20ACT11_BH20ACT11_06300 [soil metagenome]
MARPDYGRSRWYGAHSNNYSNASRGRSQISRVVVHVTQGSWSSAINWFRDGRAGVSAHYTVRSNDGFIGQSVQENDIGYHAGNWTYNKTSIGIEHEGYVSQPKWFTGAMYRSSARLTAYLCRKYRIPIDRQHIVGHNEVPGATHTDPGRYWDWNRYIRLVRKYASPSYRQIVDSSNPTRFSASRNWGVSKYSGQKYGNNYRYVRPTRRYTTDRAAYKVRIPATGTYRIWAWWPADRGYNGAARFLVRTTGGWARRYRSQRKNGGRWVGLGDFRMRAGDSWCVRVDKRSSSSGYVIADAIMVKKV